MAVDSLRTSNPSLPAVKPQEQATKPATTPAPAAPAASTTDQFVAKDPAALDKAKLTGAAPQAAVNQPGAASAADGPTATEPADPKPSEATGENREVTADMTPEQKEAYDKLTDAEREQYNDLYSAAKELSPPKKAEEAQKQLVKLLEDGKVGAYVAVANKADVQAQEELQNLLFDGTLLDGAEGEALLDVLEPFASGTTDLPTQVNRGELVSQILHDISDPEAAAQQEADQRDCGLLSMLGSIAKADPAGYAAMMVNLAEGESITLTDGNGNSVELNYNGPPNPNDPGGKTLTQQIFVGTLENFANGVNGNGMIERLIGGLDSWVGISAREMADFKQALFEEFGIGGDYEPMTVPDQGEAEARARAELEAEARARGETEPIVVSDEAVKTRADEIRARSKSDAKTVIDEQLAQGEEVQVEVNGPPSHWETVVGKVQIPLPFGGTIELYVVRDGKSGNTTMMTPGQLQDQLGAVVYNADKSQPPEGSYRPRDDDPGIGFRNDAGTGEGDGN